MRRSKMFQPAPVVDVASLSIESMSIEQILVGRAVLSVEEEQSALAEADELQSQVSADVEETTRVEDITDVMLNVADTVEESGGIDATQAMLIDTASEMAVAGSDGDPDDVIPSTEELIGADSVAVESFVADVRKRAMEIWQQIRAFCLQIWNSIVQFFRQIFQVAPRLLQRVKVLREAVQAKKKDAKDAVPKQGVVVPVVGLNSISYPDYTVRDAKELVRGLGELKSLATYAFGTYVKNCSAMGEQVAAELKKFDPKSAGEHLKTVAVGLQKNNFTNPVTSPQTGYLGCFDAVATRLDSKKTKDLSDAQIVAALRNTGVKLVPRTGKAAMLNANKGVATLSYSDMDSVLSAVEGLIKQVVAYETSADSKAIDKARAALLEGGNHASAEVGKFQGNDEAGKVERAYAVDVMKSLMNFNTTLTRWVSDLTMPVTKKIYQTSRASLVLVEKSLAQYGAKAPETVPV